MLVLTIKEDEAATLYDATGNEIGKIFIVENQGGRTRIGFDFPSNIAIARPGVTKEQALSIAGRNNEKNNNS